MSFADHSETEVDKNNRTDNLSVLKNKLSGLSVSGASLTSQPSETSQTSSTKYSSTASSYEEFAKPKWLRDQNSKANGLNFM